MSHLCKMLSAVAWLSTIAMPVAHAAGFWQPLCPNGAVCATTSRVFAANGHVLISASNDSDLPSQWVDVATLAGVPTEMRNVVAISSTGHYLAASSRTYSAYAADTTALYSYNYSSVESSIVFESHARTLGPALYFKGTSPATLINGLTLTGGTPFIYLSRNEGLAVATQSANIQLSGDRTNFATSADGQRVWVIPGPVTPGLWQTPIVADANAQLNFSVLTRADNGTFPFDVFRFRAIPQNADNAGGYSVALSTDGMFISIDSGQSWSHAEFTGLVEDIAFPIPGKADTQVIAASRSVFISRDRGHTWSELAKGLPLDHYTLNAVDGGVVAAGAGAVFLCGTLDCAGSAFGTLATVGTNTARVTEFHNTTLDHYFITADENEKTAIRNGGAGPGWVETGQNFWAWTPNVTGESAYVCRFYGDPIKGPNSHFYSAATNECRQLLGLQISTPVTELRWNSEGYAFKVSLPDSTGECGPDLIPIYRAYNNGFAHGHDSNHRYVVDRPLLQPLIATGWKDEGVAFCVPATASN